MKADRQITPPDWITDDRCVKVMRALGGYEPVPQSLFVGGCIRNFLLGRAVCDIDIATIHKPIEVMEHLKANDIRYIPTGLDHGTVTALVDGKPFEITTLRQDVQTDGRHAVVVFSDDWKVDAYRRDFTINTLLAAPDGRIFDPTGQGLGDLDKRSVKFVGDASSRIAEDYLRILRFFRFYAQYGAGQPDGDAVAACSAQSGHLEKISRERVTQELFKILSVNNPARVISLMLDCGVFPALKEKFNGNWLETLCSMQVRHDAPDVIARLFVLAGGDASALGHGLILSNTQKKNLQSLDAALSVLRPVNRKKIREAIYRHGNSIAVQAYFLALSKKNDTPDLESVDLARYWQAPAFPVRAEELIKSGIAPGPLLGQRLKELEDSWIAKDFPEIFP